MFNRRRRKRRYHLAPDADLTPHVIEKLERHVRWVAVWLKSPSHHAQINRIEVRPGSRRRVIGTCWMQDTWRGPQPRQIWIESSLSYLDECQTLIHELAHAFTPDHEDHGALFRRIYLVSWGLYYQASDREARQEIRWHLRRYQSGSFWERRREKQELVGYLRGARQAVTAEQQAKQSVVPYDHEADVGLVRPFDHALAA